MHSLVLYLCTEVMIEIGVPRSQISETRRLGTATKRLRRVHRLDVRASPINESELRPEAPFVIPSTNW